MAARIRALQDMTVPELREQYREVFGEETRSRHKEFLWRRIAWRMQANEEGDLSERALRRAAELANDADVRLRAMHVHGASASTRSPTLARVERV
ncbi:MAG: DUF2924 domain-containing protein [Planctomycetaceae bacterium]|nr:DUF2924 domain-containing protein [Planctomycetaceae bacterium]